MDPALLHQTMIIMHRTPFTIVAEINNVREAYSVAYFEPFAFSCGVDLLNVACTFVADCYGLLVVHGHGHEVGVT
jgi:hypothetical protein